MRARVLFIVIALGLSVSLSPQSGQAQLDRDFVFTDEDGHLVVRFVGTGATGLDASQSYEILNAEFSSMVHDRLHADLRFEDEPRDTAWAQSIEAQIDQHLDHTGFEFSDVFIECRADSCRVVMEQPRHWSVPEHQAALETVQQSVEEFIAARPEQFQPVFMIAAYDQKDQISHIKAFLRRTGHVPEGQSSGG
jgi:hypothetical protein